MITPAKFTAKLEEKIEHNQKFIQFEFELTQPHVLNFQAGQYVSLLVSQTGERRSYSICSSPATQHGFELLLDLSPAGLGVEFFSKLQFGDEISGLGPIGQFVLNDKLEEALVFVATGSGIAPIKAMLLELIQEKQDKRDITLYWGLRYVHELFWLDELQDMVESADNFHFYPVISKPSVEWTLSTGHVTDLLLAHNFKAQTGFYLCGSGSIVKDVKQLLLDKGVTADYLHHEKFS